MIDLAGINIEQGCPIAGERIQSVNDNMLKSHFHSFFELYLLEGGERYHVIEDKIYHVTPGELLIFAPYVMHHSYGAENMPFKRVVIYFEPKTIESAALLEVLVNGTGVYQLSGQQKHAIFKLINDVLQAKETDAFFYEYVKSLLNMILVMVLRSTFRYEQEEEENMITKVIGYIHEHYMDDITLNQLAKIHYTSTSHLCREFKKATNRTIIQYLNTTRILKAQLLFLETDLNVTQVSKAVGFSNVTHFNRVFKSIVGLPPLKSKKTRLL